MQFQENAQTNERASVMTDRPSSIGPFRLLATAKDKQKKKKKWYSVESKELKGLGKSFLKN